jgi:cytoskeletal protein RodZ
MSPRAILMAVPLLAAVLLLATGCSSDESASTTPSGQASASSSPPTPGEELPEEGSSEESSEALPPQATLGSEACIDVTSANLNLAVAANAEEARAAADVLASFDPPASVTEALEHFVGTGGVHFDDPDFTEYNARIDDWVKAVCPLQQSSG